jgi:hypothetical protein
VTDTAVWLNPAHAAVLLSAPKGVGAARRLRNDLLQRLPPYVDAAEAFASGGKFGYLRGMVNQFVAILVSAFRHIFLT